MKKFKCFYGKTFNFSMIKIGNQPIMVVDADIKDYIIHIGNHRGKYNLPQTIVLNDKLYFHEKLKDKLLETLDTFIKTNYIKNPDAEETYCGFKILNLTDIYGNTISLQECSNVDPAIWFGVNLKPSSALFWENNELKPFKLSPHSAMFSGGLHLKIKQAKKLRKLIVDLWEKYEETK